MSVVLEPIEVISGYRPHAGTLWSILVSRADADRTRDFVVFEDRTFSYGAIVEQIARAKAVFAARGVKPGHRIGVMSLNHPATVVTFFALARLGAIMVPVNPDFGVAEAAYVFSHAQVSGVLCSPAALETVRAACAEITPIPWILLNEPGAADVLVLADAIRKVPESTPEDAGTAHSTGCLIYTSGTTGFPKGVMHSQRNVVMAGEGFVQRMYLQRSDRLLCVLPMFHINALFYSLAGAVAAGAALILVRKFSASTFWKSAAETKATEVNTIAAASTILMRRPRTEFVPGHRLRKMYGGPFTEETYRVFRDEFGVATVIEGYAMSEIPGVLNNPFMGPHKIGSMGKHSRHPDPSIQLAQMKAVDDEGRELADGEVGELVVKTPIVMQGYYRDPE